MVSLPSWNFFSCNYYDSSSPLFFLFPASRGGAVRTRGKQPLGNEQRPPPVQERIAKLRGWESRRGAFVERNVRFVAPRRRRRRRRWQRDEERSVTERQKQPEMDFAKAEEENAPGKKTASRSSGRFATRLKSCHTPPVARLRQVNAYSSSSSPVESRGKNAVTAS